MSLLPPTEHQLPGGGRWWGSDAERAALAAATAAGHGYRRLPRDWEERAERPDFLERRQAAAERAEQHGHPPPPVGYTYVRPHLVTRGAVIPATRVRCQGLLALTLAAQGVGEADEA